MSGGLSLAVGGIAGYCTRGEGWEPVALPTSAVSVALVGRDVALTVRTRL